VAGRGYSLEQGEETDLLLTIRTSGNVTTSRQELPPGTTALAASPVRPELYVLNGPLGTLSILPLDGSAPTVIAVGNEPVAVAVSADGSWAYVANRQSQSISAIYLPAAAVIETIPLDGVPYSVALF
jgi:DNA-binding beta-propeller fold protein YncE